jgi:hypothetical protein
MLERYLIPLAPYLLIAAGLPACMYIFYSLKREMHVLQKRLKQRESQVDSTWQNMSAEIDRMRTDLRDAEERTAQLVPPPPARSGLNVNARTQAIRMARRGEDAHQIASKLGLPANEVKLLLKIHKMAADESPRPGGNNELNPLTS